jgi:predicted secreted hydrolase
VRVWVHHWSVNSDSGTWTLAAADGPYSLSLELKPERGPILNGERGLSRKSAERGANYYSMPRLDARHCGAMGSRSP